MIYTIGGIKGGSGKSTVATTLTVLLANSGRDVLFVDADDQGTATDFTHWRSETLETTGFTSIKLSNLAVRTEVQKLKSKYDDIVIDTGGRDTASQRAAMVVANVYIVPFIPRSFDMWTLEQVSKLIDDMRLANENLRCFAILNKIDPKGNDNNEAKEIILENGSFEVLDSPLGYRKAYANAAAQGLAVTELKPKDQKAIDEVEKMFQEILSIK